MANIVAYGQVETLIIGVRHYEGRANVGEVSPAQRCDGSHQVAVDRLLRCNTALWC